MPTAFEALTNGQTVFVDLLTERPASSQVSTWKLPSWQGYYTAGAVPIVLGTQGPQTQVRIDYPELIEAGQLTQLWGVGVYAGPNALFIWPLPQGQGAGRLVIDVSVAKAVP